MFKDEYRKIILLDAIQLDWLQFGNRYVKEIDNDDQFMETYMKPLNEDNKLAISKSMLNTFRVMGNAKDVCKFFNEFKVNKKFLLTPKDFQLIAPIVVISTNTFGHKYNFGLGFGPKEAFDLNSTMSMNNQTGYIIQGRWEDLYEQNKLMEYETRVKRCTPSELVKHIKHLLEIKGVKANKDICICVEFFVNCKGLSGYRMDLGSQTIFFKDVD